MRSDANLRDLMSYTCFYLRDSRQSYMTSISSQISLLPSILRTEHEKWTALKMFDCNPYYLYL